MELRSQKKYPKSGSTTSTFIDENGNVYISINDTTIQIIDVSKVMESSLFAVKTDDANGIAVENNFRSAIGINQETVSSKPQKTNQACQNKNKTYLKKTKIKGKRKKTKSSFKIYRVSGSKKEKSATLATCDICGKSYNNKSYLKEHKRRHEDTKEFKCSLCDRRFNMDKDLKNHIKSHLKERAFSCAICDKRFTRKSLLNYHMRIHTGERPYECNICHMTFTRPFGLSQHKRRIHSSNKGKDIRCTEKDCDKMFVTSIEREMHVTVWHRRDMPFKCSLCHYSFSNRVSLYTHNKSHHSTEKPFVCPSLDCDMAFKVVWRLQNHIKLCHKGFMYKCPHCPLEFKMKNELNLHMKISNSHKKVK